MSELVTWGVKMPEEMKNKMSELLRESGLQGKEFVEHLATLYESSNIKQIQPLLSQDLEEVETITRRLINIFTGMGERVTITLKDRDNQYNSKLSQQQEILSMLHDKVKAQEMEIISLNESNKGLRQIVDEADEVKDLLKSDYETKIKQLTELLESNKALTEEYKSKNDTLTGQLDEYREYKEKVKGLILEVQEEKEEHRKTKDSLSQLQQKADHLEEQIKETKEKQKEEIQGLKDKLVIEHEKESLKKDREYQNMIQSIRDEYNTKVKGFLDELGGTNEDNKTEKPKTTTKKK